MPAATGPIEEYPGLLEFVKSGKFTHRLYPHQENLMNMFEQGRKLQELTQLVRDFPDAEPVMIQSEGMDRLRKADPEVNVSQVIREALDEAANKAEEQAKARRKAHRVKMDRVLKHASQALKELQAAVIDLEDGAVDTRDDAKKLDSRMKATHRVLRQAGLELRAAYGIKPTNVPRNVPRNTGRNPGLRGYGRHF